jgi:hypothetical protein
MPLDKTTIVTVTGACVAALVAGVFSLLSLVISKEQKISEFRQAWIDALRKDLATLIAHAYQIHAFCVGTKADFAQFWSLTRADYIDLNKAAMRIKLRLNAGEKESNEVLVSMAKIENLFLNLHALPNDSLEKLNIAVRELEQTGPVLLKTEWQVVKNGERTYRAAKWIAVLATLIFIVLVTVTVVWLICSSASISPTAGSSLPAK